MYVSIFLFLSLFRTSRKVDKLRDVMSARVCLCFQRSELDENKHDTADEGDLPADDDDVGSESDRRSSERQKTSFTCGK